MVGFEFVKVVILKQSVFDVLDLELLKLYKCILVENKMMNCVDLRIGYVLLDIIIIIVVNNCRSFIKI